MKKKKVHLYDFAGGTVCGIPLTENMEATESVTEATCKRCEKATAVR